MSAKIGSSIYEKSTPESEPQVRDRLQDVHLEQDYWVENAEGEVPQPPPYILKKLAARDLMWRWLSVAQVKVRGMREYESYSPDAEDRDQIDRGHCAPGLKITTDNRVGWREDSFLGTLPRRRYLHRQAAKRQVADNQTAISKSGDVLKEAAARLGAKANVSVEERVGGEDFR